MATKKKTSERWAKLSSEAQQKVEAIKMRLSEHAGERYGYGLTVRAIKILNEVDSDLPKDAAYRRMAKELRLRAKQSRSGKIALDLMEKFLDELIKEKIITKVPGRANRRR